ncbi:MAG: hypothetical protein DLM69_09875 [Candidatus Chloroheliales bacterium]|nr:MAG: hypothetical protein DLM69_09875 [Chloroflexota bacterium]
MSWDVFLMRVPEGVTSVRDLPDGFEPEAIGTPDEVVAIIRHVCPEAQFDGNRRGSIDAFAMDIGIQSNDAGLANFISFSIYGGVGERGIDIIKNVCQATGCKAIDGGEDFLRFDGDAEVQAQQWQRYRDYVVGLHSAPPPGATAKSKKDDEPKPL